MKPTRLILLLSTITLATNAQPAPTADDAKRAIDQKLQKIWKNLGTAGERTVLFQAVAPGRPSAGSYRFRVSLTMHDYEAGYPKNRYYGQTCVGKIEEERYVLTLDEFGAWQAEGRMTANMPDKTCKPNAASGVASIPVESLQGTKASAGVAGPVQPVTTMRVASTSSGKGVALGAYECWANGQSRELLNFTVLANNQYRDADGTTNSFAVDASNGRITFKGGLLSSFLPPGFYYVYYAPQGRPTVSFRNSGGTEVTFCQKR
jgi:hypothetical protein